MEKIENGSENHSKNSIRDIISRWNENNFLSEEEIIKNRQMERSLAYAVETLEHINACSIKPYMDREFLKEYGPGVLVRFGDLVKEILIYYNLCMAAENWEKGVQELYEKEKL